MGLMRERRGELRDDGDVVTVFHSLADSSFPEVDEISHACGMVKLALY
jgi:hypothetical protein